MTLTCGACMVRKGVQASAPEPRSATTIVHGTAVCGEHFADLVTPGLVNELKRQMGVAE